MRSEHRFGKGVPEELWSESAGAVWAVPAVTVATAVPAFASSPSEDPIIIEPVGEGGEACKIPSEKKYRFTFSFDNTLEGPEDGKITVRLTNFVVNGNERTPDPATVDVPFKESVEEFIYFVGAENMANGEATLYYEYDYILPDGTTKTVEKFVTTEVEEDKGNNLDVCK